MLLFSRTESRKLLALQPDHGKRGKLAALLFADLDARIAVRAALYERIAECAHEGKLLVVESGRDCDGVQYAGQSHMCDATVKAFYDLHDNIGKWADGPFRLEIVPFDELVEYTSRDLGMEAFENGHAHCL